MKMSKGLFYISISLYAKTAKFGHIGRIDMKLKNIETKN